jgi:hypothetical protein
MSDAADIVARREEAERQRIEAASVEAFRRLGEQVKPLAIKAAANMRRLGFPAAPSSYMGISTIDGEQRVTWVLDTTVRLLDDGMVLGLEPGVDGRRIIDNLEAIANYRPPVPVKPQKKAGKFRMWLEAQGITDVRRR